MKTVRILLLVTILLTVMVTSVSASSPYYSYTYSYQSDGSIVDIAAPLPYLPDGVLGAAELQVPLKAPEDLVIDAAKEHFYIVDSGTNAVYCFDRDFQLVKTIDSYVENGETKTFASPTGIFLDVDNSLYVADTNNGRVVVLDTDGNFVKAISRPESVLLSEDFTFMPLKVVADEAGRIFVLCKNVYEGLMQFSAEGTFIGFIGSNRVVFKLTELVWKTIMTDEQKEGLTSFVPVEYTNISLDSDGFIYAVTSVKNVEAPIRRLNYWETCCTRRVAPPATLSAPLLLWISPRTKTATTTHWMASADVFSPMTKKAICCSFSAASIRVRWAPSPVPLPSCLWIMTSMCWIKAVAR